MIMFINMTITGMTTMARLLTNTKNNRDSNCKDYYKSPGKDVDDHYNDGKDNNNDNDDEDYHNYSHLVRNDNLDPVLPNTRQGRSGNNCFLDSFFSYVT